MKIVKKYFKLILLSLCGVLILGMLNYTNVQALISSSEFIEGTGEVEDPYVCEIVVFLTAMQQELWRGNILKL